MDQITRLELFHYYYNGLGSSARIGVIIRSSTARRDIYGRFICEHDGTCKRSTYKWDKYRKRGRR